MNRIVKVVLRGDVQDFIGGMTAAASAAKSTVASMTDGDKEARRFRDGLTTVGTSATRAGLVTAAGVGLITKAAIDWESAWAGVTKTISGTPAQLSAIEQGLRQMAQTIPVSHKELAGIAEAAGQLGVQTDSILEFTRVMADLSVTTNLSADEAATSIAQFMNVMQTAPDQVDQLGAALVALGNDGASTERDIIQMAQGIAGAGAIVGASEADVLALANALASVGIDAEAGGSAVSKILIDMSKSVATNSKSLESWAATAGMTTAEFAQNFGEDPVKAFDSFTQGLGRINAEGGDVFTLLSSLGQSDVRVTRALLGMANSGDLLSRSLATGSREWDRNLALTKEAEKRYDTTAAKATIAWNSIKDSAIDAGQAMLPIVAGVADSVSKLTGLFGKLPGPVKGATGVLALFTAGGLLAVGGIVKVVNGVSSFKDALEKIDTKAPATARALGLVAKGFAAISAASVAAAALERWDKVDVKGVNQFTKALLNAADGSDKLLNSISSTGSSGLFGWNRNEIDGIADAFSKAADGAGKMDLSFGHDSGWERGATYVEQVDQALTSLVSSGAIDRATDAFNYLGEETGLTNEKLKALLPGYTEALSGLDLQSQLSTDSTTNLAGATDQLTDAQKAAEDAAHGQAESIVSISDAAGEADGSLAKFRDQLIEQAKALKDLRLNAEEAGKKGVDEGLIASLRDAGPEGAAILARLADASDSEIAQINAAYQRGEVEIGKYTDAANAIPTDIKTKVTADTISAMNKLRGVTQYLNGMNGRIVRVKVEGSQGGILRAQGGAIEHGFAAGGSVVGAGTGTSDSIPAVGPGGARYALSNGEHVLTADEVTKLGGQGAVYAMRAAIRNRQFAFADGGGVGLSSVQGVPVSAPMDERSQVRVMRKAFDGMQFELSQDNRYLKTKVRNG